MALSLPQPSTAQLAQFQQLHAAATAPRPTLGEMLLPQLEQAIGRAIGPDDRSIAVAALNGIYNMEDSATPNLHRDSVLKTAAALGEHFQVADLEEIVGASKNLILTSRNDMHLGKRPVYSETIPAVIGTLGIDGLTYLRGLEKAVGDGLELNDVLIHVLPQLHAALGARLTPEVFVAFNNYCGSTMALANRCGNAADTNTVWDGLVAPLMPSITRAENPVAYLIELGAAVTELFESRRPHGKPGEWAHVNTLTRDVIKPLVKCGAELDVSLLSKLNSFYRRIQGMNKDGTLVTAADEMLGAAIARLGDRFTTENLEQLGQSISAIIRVVNGGDPDQQIALYQYYGVGYCTITEYIHKSPGTFTVESMNDLADFFLRMGSNGGWALGCLETFLPYFERRHPHAPDQGETDAAVPTRPEIYDRLVDMTHTLQLRGVHPGYCLNGVYLVLKAIPKTDPNAAVESIALLAKNVGISEKSSIHIGLPRMFRGVAFETLAEFSRLAGIYRAMAPLNSDHDYFRNLTDLIGPDLCGARKDPPKLNVEQAQQLVDFGAVLKEKLPQRWFGCLAQFAEIGLPFVRSGRAPFERVASKYLAFAELERGEIRHEIVQNPAFGELLAAQ